MDVKSKANLVFEDDQSKVVHTELLIAVNINPVLYINRETVEERERERERERVITCSSL